MQHLTLQCENFTNQIYTTQKHTTMKEIINIIESSMVNTEKTNDNDRHFQLTMLAIATILLFLMEWIY